jgi:UDP-N-acetylmuramate dehydrogenase
MVHIQENFSLKHCNTFGIDVKARYFVRVSSIPELKEVLSDHRNCFPFMIMGEGSNILFTRDFNGIIIHPALKGVNIVENDLEHCIVEVGAGENWDDFVRWSVENNLGGIENLSLIPGSTGSSPIQNIGAYGAEVKDVVQRVNYLDLETFKITSIPNRDCNFGYRSSIFKTHLKNKVVITSVIFRLSHHPQFNTSYGNLQSEVEKMGGPNLETIRKAVISIRKSKLPDPKIIGNAGSFFKNPVIEAGRARQLQEEYDQMPVYPVSDQWTKIPAGWLIEKCGWKGKKNGNTGVHEKQALVLVNYGNASGEDIRNLAMQISASVDSRFGISLEPEVNII